MKNEQPSEITKRCSLCAEEKPLSHYLQVQTADQKIYHGRVCFGCLGITDNLFKSRIDKLAFRKAKHILFYEEDEDEGGSGGWDPEDRAKALRLILSKSGRARDAAAKSDAKKAEQKDYEDKLYHEKLDAEKEQKDSKAEKSDGFKGFLKKSFDSLSGKTDKPSVTTPIIPIQDGEQSAAEKTATAKVEYTTQPTRQPTTPRDGSATAAQNQAAQANQATANQNIANQAKATGTARANQAQFAGTAAQNQLASANFTVAGQSHIFLSPYGIAATNVRNRAVTGPTLSFANSMFDKINPKAPTPEKNEAPEGPSPQEESARLQKVYNDLKGTWKS